MTEVTTHEQLQLVCGDTWEINGTILDDDGSPMNLTGIGINWKLDTFDGQTNALDFSIGTGITVVDALAGSILIKVPKEQSATVKPGLYYDWLRITLTDTSSYTEWTGVIQALRNPKGATP